MCLSVVSVNLLILSFYLQIKNKENRLKSCFMFESYPKIHCGRVIIYNMHRISLDQSI